jgi:transcriptional regulator with AAA-type ATPase domain
MSGRGAERDRPKGETTHPATSTRRERKERRELAIQWVFPRDAHTVLTSQQKLLGRGDHCDTVLPGTETSREHADVWREASFGTIRDRGSVNGVFVNGVRRDSAPLGAGDVVRVGDAVGIVMRVAGDESTEFGEIAPGWFGGARLKEALEPLRLAAKSSLPIVIEGATGTGKEGLCAAIHAWSERKGPLVPVNCAALPEQLAEAELFGYRQGAFTGAARASTGFIRAANGGTLMLDEVVELSMPLQAKLLRVLEERAVYPLGESKPVPVDFRVVSAAQEPLERRVEDKSFREDLRARLEGLVVVLPPLSERREDVVPLFLRVLAEASGGEAPSLEPRFVERLLLYDWPLNVRELVLLATQLVATRPGETLRRSHLPPRILDATSRETTKAGSRARLPTDDAESIEALAEAVRTNEGNLTRAAQSLGISRQRAYRLLKARTALDVESLRETGEPESEPR